MKVYDLIGKFVDNYKDIVIGVYGKLTEEPTARYVISPHSTSFRHIPKDVLYADVEIMVLYYDELHVCVNL